MLKFANHEITCSFDLLNSCWKKNQLKLQSYEYLDFFYWKPLGDFHATWGWPWTLTAPGRWWCHSQADDKSPWQLFQSPWDMLWYICISKHMVYKVYINNIYIYTPYIPYVWIYIYLYNWKNYESQLVCVSRSGGETRHFTVPEIDQVSDDSCFSAEATCGILMLQSKSGAWHGGSIHWVQL